MESVINPLKNPSRSLKLKYDKKILCGVDKELFEELKEYVEENKGVFMSISHYIRCAIIQKLRPNDKERIAFLEGYEIAINDLNKKLIERKKENE